MRLSVPAACVAMAALAACAPKQQPTAAVSPHPASNIVPGSQEDLVANVGDRVFFDFNKSNLDGKGPRTASNIDVLTRQVAWLKVYGQNNVQVAGNCDERGTEEYNLALGDLRARTVKTYMVARGIAPARITTISYGKERPVALGSDEEAWSQNRNAITSLK
ncbi:MAG TPA: OmpA family protein [Rhodopila sp.]|uniref:OmpA family protein n=1 Tax=Rhodopila sp. TaxID=2480087 RepID=UPI002BDAC4B4|nr:OmpA family protein [Rhodopila sp.]HVY14104.1 OmpA family protein [Rhodopila sp.]